MAQTRPVTADIGANIERHKELVASASSERVDAIIFPELSLTGYEPTLARELACDPDERRFEDFQQIANDKNIVLGVGVPTRLGSGNRISMIFFRPHVGEQEVAVIAWSGKGAPAYPRFPSTQGLSGSAVATRRTVMSNDVTNDPRYLTAFASTQSELIVPVVDTDSLRVLGTLDVESEAKNAFADADVRKLEEIPQAVLPLWK